MVLTIRLIAIAHGLSEAVEVALPHLFPANCGRSNLDETGCAKRRADVVRSPRPKGILCPLFAALNTFDTQFIHDLHSSLRIDYLVLSVVNHQSTVNGSSAAAEQLGHDSHPQKTAQYLATHCANLFFYLLGAAHLFLFWHLYVDGVGCQVYRYRTPVSLYNGAN